MTTAKPIPLHGLPCLVCTQPADFLVGRVVLHTKGYGWRCDLPPLDTEHPQYYRRARAS